MSPLNPQTIDKLRESRGLTVAQLAKRADLSPAQFSEVMENPGEAKVGVVKDIASALGVDEFLLYYRPESVPVGPLPDFRRDNTPTATLSPATYRAIDTARALRATAAHVAPEHQRSELRHVGMKNSPSSAAESARAVLRLDFHDQIEAKSANNFYADLRFKIEDDNIFVLQDSFPAEDGAGFSLSDGEEPAVIVVNTKSTTIGRRIFTLAHELFHVIRGESGISAPFSPTKAERDCDRFATELLMPAKEFIQYIKLTFPNAQSFIELIPRIANKIKLSQQAVALRLDELRLEFGIYRAWVRLVGVRNPDLIKPAGGGSSGRDENKIKLARFGTHFAEVFSAAIDAGSISFLGLFELSGLKRDFARPYFEYANSVRRLGSRDNVFQDED
ncbi:MAG TPA: XRE family transcriptional regulator [Caulobacteraceae bacterium]|nr:XRE family transcriptional regulator [Caulobacteraceae bacterium]